MYRLDKRSLALYRFFLGIVIIGELIWRSFNLRIHYTREGLKIDNKRSNFYLTIHSLSGAVEYQVTLFILHGILAFMFSIGFYTKLVTVLLYIFTTSLNNYAILFNCSGDVLNNALLLFVMFLPVGEVWSVDKALRVNNDHHESKKKNDDENVVFNFSTVGFILQIQAMYIFTTLYKTGNSWRVDYTATYLALQILYFQLPFGKLLLKLPMFILKMMTWAVFKWERYGPLFYTSPIYSDYFRIIGVICFILLHLGFGLSLALGTFMWIPLTSTLALLPPLFWDKVFEFLKTDNRAYDIVIVRKNSSFAHYLGLFVNNFLLLPYTKTDHIHESKVSSPSYYLKENSNISQDDVFISVITDNSDKTLKNTSALMYILLNLCPFTSPLSRIKFLKTVSGKRLLNNLLIKFHRMTIYREDDVRKLNIDKKIKRIQSMKYNKIYQYLNIIIGSAVSILAIVIIIYLNLANSGVINSPQSIMVNRYAKIYSLDQPWRMFSPNPPNFSFCPLIMGTLANNQTVDLFRGGAVTKANFKPYIFHESYECPPNLGELIGDVRWYKFFEGQIPNEFRFPLGRYICSNFNKENVGSQSLVRFEVKYIYLKTNLDWTRDLWNVKRIFGFDCTRNAFIP